jgi:phosphate transport system protein
MTQTHLEQELSTVKSKMFKMLDYAIEAIQGSVDSLKAVDIKRAEKLIENDRILDKLEMEVDDECIKILVTRQPAASDMRLVLSIMKINTDLERIGDLAVTIARQTKKLEGQAFIKPLIDIPRMADICIDMLKDSIESITTKNADVSKKVIDRDDVLDNLNEQIYRELSTVMAENPRTMSQALCLIQISKSLERIGDHVTNIAEKAIYYIQGDDVRHPSL